MLLITPADLAEFIDGESEAKLEQIIADATADATRVAPCLLTLEEALSDDPDRLELVRAQVRSILRSALVRWAESGNGALTQLQQTSGPFSMNQSFDTRQRRGGMFWPSEITALQDICKSLSDDDDPPTRAFNVDQIAPRTAGNHQPWCSVTWGAWCSCGAVLTRGEYPLWEGGLLS